VSNEKPYGAAPPQQGWNPEQSGQWQQGGQNPRYGGFPQNGQNLQYGQVPQNGQFPPGSYPPGPQGPQHPPPAPGGRRTGVVVLSVLAAVVLIGGVIFGVSQVASSGDKAAGPGSADRPATGQPSNNSISQPTASPTTGQAGGPVLCEPRGVFLCFPTATVSSVSAIVKGKGGKCRKDGADLKCVKGGSAESIDVTLMPSIDNPKKLSTLIAMTFSRAAGDNAKGRLLVMSNLKTSMPTLMKALLPGEPKTQQQISTWLPKDFEKCPADPVRIGGYLVSCESPWHFIVPDTKGVSMSSWSVGIKIDSATAFPPR
jgi:hypothetical protein